MLTVNNITVQKNQQIILQNVGFSAGLGSCILLTGKNGVGKTTLLKTIAGLIIPSSGEVLWNDENIQNFYTDFSSDINYIGHKNFLKPELSVLQNIKFHANLSGTAILIPLAIKYFGLENVLEKPVCQLSSGWQKKILLSKLIYQPKTLWLLDEPTVNLDKKNQELLHNLLETRTKENGLIIIATHDEALFSLGSVICLEDFK